MLSNTTTWTNGAQYRAKQYYGVGVGASLFAEAVFMTMVMMISAIRGKDPWMVTKVPGSFLVGPEAVQPPGFVAGDVALGLMMHLLLGILVGIMYAWGLPRVGVSPVIGGLITGAILYALGFWILPLMFYEWLSPFWLPPMGRLLQAIAHAVYGVAFGVAYGRLTHIHATGRTP